MDYTPGNPFADLDAVETAPPGAEPADGDLHGLTAVFDRDANLTELTDVAEALAAAIGRIVNAADAGGDLLSATLAAKDIRDAFGAHYDTARTRLWSIYGAGQHATDDGRTFTFSTPGATRRTDVKRLEAEYPDVYAAVVTSHPPKPDAVGTLRLTTPKKGAK